MLEYLHALHVEENDDVKSGSAAAALLRDWAETLLKLRRAYREQAADTAALAGQARRASLAL